MMEGSSNGGLALSEAFEYDGSSCIGESEGGSQIDGHGASVDHRETLLNERKIVEKMAQKESQKVKLWRRNVLVVMALTGALVTAMTYIFLDRVDVEDFEASFQQFAQSIRDSTEFNLRGLIEATNGLAQVFTSEAIKTNSHWPFMTLSSFEVYVTNTRAQGASELIVIAPFVNSTQIPQWNQYATASQGWIDESFQEYDTGRIDLNPIPSSVYRFGRFKGRTVLKPEDGLGGYPAAPFWQMSRPPFDTSIVNFNALSEEAYQQMYDAMTQTNHWVMGIAGPNTLIDYTISEQQHDELHSASELNSINNTGFANDHPHTALLYPVYRDKDASHPSGSDINSPQVAMILNVIPWDNYIKRLLPHGVNGIYCVLHNSAGQHFTYSISGPDAAYLGPEDFHERDFDEYEVRITFDQFLDLAPSTVNESYTGVFANYGNLEYWFSIYPSKELKSGYETNTPIIFAAVVVAVFVFMTVTFILYDRYVTRKNNKILDAATHSNAILASLFPQNVKERLLEDKAQEVQAEAAKKKEEKKLQKKGFRADMDHSMEDFLSRENLGGEDANDEILKSKPIADVFEEATVLFADLVGFTAWSSSRQPTDVFVLLETLYRNFDMIAKRRRVYKVETIGDCYVAVTGCPTPRKDHHVAMCRFATETMRKMKKLCRKLESVLGPDTSDLNMRFGLHSGSVTGGVLRGERSRFQLFGDTMNTAARMESNGQPGKVHLSDSTADLLIKSGKQHWVVEREDKIVAKGKGEMTTYWLRKTTSGPSSVVSSMDSDDMTENDDESEEQEVVEVEMGNVSIQLNPKTQRVVDWTVQSFMNILERLATARETHGLQRDIRDKTAAASSSATPLDELQDIVSFHRYPDAQKDTVADIVLDQHIEDQVELFVAIISRKYGKNNSFHNFEHAAAMLQTVLKLFSRMGNSKGSDDALDFSSDPLAVFACAFTALIHDVDHPGVPNFRLKTENPELAAKFKDRSIAEQHSFKVAWDLLQEERFNDFRNTICPDSAEEARFRQLVITAIMATDLFDKDLNDQRIQRWTKAFESGGSGQEEESPKQALDRKATIVLETLIQVADISHTMTHWEIYRKWNNNLFEEMNKAFSDGRSEDPSSFWYQGELDFFDRHVIPLAKQTAELGCFGILGGEFLQKSNQNREEWAEKGNQIVAQMKSSNGKREGVATTDDLPEQLPPPLSPARARIRSIRKSQKVSQSSLTGRNGSFATENPESTNDMGMPYAPMLDNGAGREDREAPKDDPLPLSTSEQLQTGANELSSSRRRSTSAAKAPALKDGTRRRSTNSDSASANDDRHVAFQLSHSSSGDRSDKTVTSSEGAEIFVDDSPTSSGQTSGEVFHDEIDV
ncbi:Receptor-type guanylate cyclase gcy [Seminavis robusta]|uniref:Receptor-type guanylate cyclase gcy n=1 Tax=Seminavis robusta TaxID=568900 RepID=A0A9N8HXB7_9STRA|nr:Receptor-type guanylate cyclase gcy [Seminavis robusta]|eukprot:Sro2408_g326640.1 Receptor-type guanylate cyclase gcy (1356) ;mRNA; f:6980-12548